MVGRPRRQIVEDKVASPECNLILHVLASCPRTGGSRAACSRVGGDDAAVRVVGKPTGGPLDH